MVSLKEGPQWELSRYLLGIEPPKDITGGILQTNLQVEGIVLIAIENYESVSLSSRTVLELVLRGVKKNFKPCHAPKQDLGILFKISALPFLYGVPRGLSHLL